MKSGLKVKDNDRGTRTFSKWYTVYDETGEFQLAQICCCPYSVKGKQVGGIFDPGATTIQLCNRYCYAPNPIEVISKIARIIDFQFQSISRLDICYDFRLFDNQMKPLTLIRGYYNSKYWKMGLNKALGVGYQSDMYDGQTLSFAGRNSAVCTKLYNKSREMKDVHVKPYVSDAWSACDMADEQDVWRLEVSIKSDGRNLVNLGSGETIKFGLKDIQTHEQRAALFFTFARKYWHWRYHEPGVRKSRSKDVELFKYSASDDIWKPTKLTATRDYDRRAKIVMNALQEIIEDNTLSISEHNNALNLMLTIGKKYRIIPKNKGQTDDS
jgi:hypothetical protein